jgi:hypothetical protein
VIAEAIVAFTEPARNKIGLMPQNSKSPPGRA